MQTVVIFSGAGISKESGIPTFRDSKDGLWYNYKVEEVSDHEAWSWNKEAMLKFYAERTNNVKLCEPNAAHYAIAKLQEKFNVINITQNIDDLLERAGCKEVWHLHGSIHYRKCEWHKAISVLDGDTQFTCDYKAEQDKPCELGELCPKCGGQLRPDVVFFGEAVDLREAEMLTLAAKTWCFIGIGTSAQVNPAAQLLYTFSKCPRKYFIDPNPPLRLQSFDRRAGTATEHMPKVAEELLALAE